MNAVLEEIQKTGIVAIVRLENYDQGGEIAEALCAGGISVFEFTLTGRRSHQAVTRVRHALGDQAHIGIGTVLNPQQAREAMDAEAEFIVTPTMRTDVIHLCRKQGVPIVCGALTPTEALTAHEAGADLIKIFPARTGGPTYIRDLLAPLPHLRLVPTGGITAQNAGAYLQAGAIAVGIGGNLVSQQVVAARDWTHITSVARECVRAVQGYIGEAHGGDSGSYVLVFRLMETKG